MSQPFDGSDATRPFQKKGFVLSAVFLVAVVLVGALVIFTSGDGSDNGTTAAEPTAPVPTSAAAPSPATSDGSCPAFGNADPGVPTRGPAAEWGLLRTQALPSSTEAGPALSDGDLRRCFAHSPTGALIAAAQISSRSMLAGNWQDVWEQQTYGDTKDEQLAALTEQFSSSPLPDPAPGELGQYAGFHFVTYSPDSAVVELLVRFTDGTLRVSTASLRWHEGDWQLEVSDTAQQRSVSSEEGFVAWGGV